MDIRSSNIAPTDQPDRETPQLSAADQAILAELLEEPAPMAPTPWLSPEVNVTVTRDGREYAILARAPYRIAILGTCEVCEFPFILDGQPGLVKKDNIPRRCERHRPRPPALPKKSRRKIIDVDHEVTPHQAIADAVTPGDILNRGGHLYVVCGTREAISQRTGQLMVLIDTVGACAECGEPFRLSRTPNSLDRENLTRRCPTHRRPGFHRLTPWKWTADTLEKVREFGR